LGFQSMLIGSPWFLLPRINAERTRIRSGKHKRRLVETVNSMNPSLSEVYCYLFERPAFSSRVQRRSH